MPGMLRLARTALVLAGIAVAFGLVRGYGAREPLALPAPPPLTAAPGDTGATEPAESPPPLPDASGVAGEEEAAASPPDGFVVWESNRSGRWRLYRQRLDGSGLERLTPDDDALDHCCSHISPDGGRLAYLRYRPGQRRSSDAPPRATLHLLELKSGDERILADPVRLPSEMRAVTWLDDGRLLYVDADGHTQRLDIESGERTRMTRTPHPEDGWLMNASLEFATAAWVTFSPYDRATKAIAERRDLGGCQPYFSHDGRYGFWVAGAGGPIHRIDLATREVAPLLRKHDPLLPAGRGYLYFPMVSKDGGLLAFAASPDEHDFRHADYDIFVVETDPRTLLPVAAPRRLTSHPSTDRFPDVFQPTLPLGRHLGEAPYAVGLAVAPGPEGSADEWRWSLGDGSERSGPSIQHTYTEPGVYEVIAHRGDDRLRGRIRVLDRRRSPVETAEAVPPSPNAAGAPAWPSDRRSLVLLWENGDAPNLVFDPELGTERTHILEPRALARLDRDFRMQLDGGAFVGDEGAAERLAQALRDTNEMTLELVLEAAELATDEASDLVSFGAADPRRLVFRLTQIGRELAFDLRGGTARLLELTGSGPHHLAVTYSPGQLRAYLDGRPVAGVEPLTGDFFHARLRPLVFGSGPWGGRDWRGWLEGIALYNRALAPSEIEANAAAFSRRLAARRPVESRQVTATLRRRTPIPTLEQIEPYRQALVVYEWEAAGEKLLVAHWALLDGKPTPAAGLRAGQRSPMRLEPFDANPQLEGQILEDSLSAPGDRLWFDAGPW